AGGIGHLDPVLVLLRPGVIGGLLVVFWQGFLRRFFRPVVPVRRFFILFFPPVLVALLVLDKDGLFFSSLLCRFGVPIRRQGLLVFLFGRRVADEPENMPAKEGHHHGCDAEDTAADENSLPPTASFAPAGGNPGGQQVCPALRPVMGKPK